MIMKEKVIFLSIVLVMCLFINRPSGAEVLSVSNTVSTINTTVQVGVQLDDPSSTAAAVFSILYNPVHLVPVAASGTPFFGQFSWQDNGSGKVMVCGARTNPFGSGSTTIATITFQVLTTATFDYTIELDDSHIYNTAAGYNGEAVPAIIGPFSTDFTVLMADTSTSVPGVISIDRDNDGLTDTVEDAYGTDKDDAQTINGIADVWLYTYYSVLALFEPFSDDDSDGYSNLREGISDTDPGDGGSKPIGFLPGVGDDGDIDGSDLQLLVMELKDPACSGPSCICDFNGDGIVDGIDLMLLVEDFGK